MHVRSPAAASVVHPGVVTGRAMPDVSMQHAAQCTQDTCVYIPVFLDPPQGCCALLALAEGGRLLLVLAVRSG